MIRADLCWLGSGMDGNFDEMLTETKHKNSIPPYLFTVFRKSDATNRARWRDCRRQLDKYRLQELLVMINTVVRNCLQTKIVIQEKLKIIFHLPGNINYAGDSFDSFPNGWAALSGPDAIPSEGLLQIVAFVGALELFVMKDIEGAGNEFVGDFRNGALDFGWDTFDEETKLSKRAIELNNGRAAMMGILGLMVHEQLGGSVPFVGEL